MFFMLNMRVWSLNIIFTNQLPFTIHWFRLTYSLKAEQDCRVSTASQWWLHLRHKIQPLSTRDSYEYPQGPTYFLLYEFAPLLCLLISTQTHAFGMIRVSLILPYYLAVPDISNTPWGSKTINHPKLIHIVGWELGVFGKLQFELRTFSWEWCGASAASLGIVAWFL